MDEPDVIGSETVYDGKMITVRRDTLRQDGKDVVREVVDHPDSVAIVALDDQGRVLLIRQYRHPVGRVLWELPAGLLDKAGENPLEAARRELAEETGLQAAQWSELVAIHTSPGMTGEHVQIFTARDLSPATGSNQPDADEGTIEPSWIPLADAVEMVQRGEITNALAVAGLLSTTGTH
jgi:8-oxo-dGTP pyrophosphatase MutT (NUDIX family)